MKGIGESCTEGILECGFRLFLEIATGPLLFGLFLLFSGSLGCLG